MIENDGEMSPHQRCACHGKTEAELAAPYALFAFSLPLAALIALFIVWVTA